MSPTSAKQLDQEQIDLEVNTLTEAIAVNGTAVFVAGSSVPAERSVEGVLVAEDGSVKVSVTQADGEAREVQWSEVADAKQGDKVDVQVRVEASAEGKDAALQFTVKCQ